MSLRLSAFCRKPIPIENHHFSRITAHHKLTTVQLSLRFSFSPRPVTVYGTETEVPLASVGPGLGCTGQIARRQRGSLLLRCPASSWLKSFSNANRAQTL